ncbi:uncharacterized protein BO97DRAFT_450924 [Aspergillus homomorphus CBS 101889]|uniref:F-box domain-containing protein n=1 Tax=Aspergillus homomorphus (strain CBS 101889) TaxID=1450537 RepID=A0A395HYB3_ASPHC|nr:hypothetical protein BO97DRAFT_450924 [Aspergillus homomorphus CBS 101889]RAL12911.1 hypothetical protein BO97DRAFT_450924 [Aspergillus homomorphus CBS 101889]
MAESPIEALPIELRFSILHFIDDFNTLDSLILTSHAFYDAFIADRHKLLWNLVKLQYNGLVNHADAIAAVRSKGLLACEPFNKAKIIALLDRRRRSDEIRRLKTSSSDIPPDEPADVNEIVELYKLHRASIFFLDDLCKTAKCPPWMNPSQWKDGILPLKLSETETKRILRAFYRLQLYCNLFGALERSVQDKYSAFGNPWQFWRICHPDLSEADAFSDEEAWDVLFATIAPWELHELGCFWYMVYNRWEEPWSEIIDRLRPFGPCSVEEMDLKEKVEPPLYPPGSDTSSLRSTCGDYLTSIGPMFLVQTLRDEDSEYRKDLVWANSQDCGEEYFPQNWPVYVEDVSDFHLCYPADQFQVDGHWDALRKSLSTMDPNFPGTYADAYNSGYYPDWEWGSALWDDDRLREWKAPEVE